MPNISRNKANQTMKLGHIIDYNMRNIFLEKSYTKCRGETTLRSFSGKLELSISLDRYSRVLFICFYCIPSWGLSKYIESRLQTTCFYLILGIFKKRVCSQSLCLIFCIISWPSFIVWLPLFVRYWAMRVLQLFFNHVLTSWILKLTLSFWPSRFFYMTKKSW